MTLLLSVPAKDAGLDAVINAIGSSAVMKLWTGTVPATLSSADTGLALVTYPLSTAWGTAPASSGAKNLANVIIAGATTTIGGIATYFRVYDHTNTAQIQGTVSVSGGGGDMTLSDTDIVPGNPVVVQSWLLVDGNPS